MGVSGIERAAKRKQMRDEKVQIEDGFITITRENIHGN